jgi:hypothetical protein
MMNRTDPEERPCPAGEEIFINALDDLTQQEWTTELGFFDVSKNVPGLMAIIEAKKEAEDNA